MAASTGCVGQPPKPPHGDDETGSTTSASATSSASADDTGPPDTDTIGTFDDAEPPPEPVCGNGIIEGEELCDDGNDEDSDGCSADCSAAECLVPITHATVQAGVDDAACPTVWILGGTYSEQVTIDRDVTLRETESGPVEIDAGGAGRPLTVDAGSVVIGALRLTGGVSVDGGGIYNAADLLLDGTDVSGNRAEGPGVARGGGVFNAGGALALVNARVIGNTAEPSAGTDETLALGGGVYSDAGTVQLLAGSEVTGNQALAAGPWSQAQGGGLCLTGAQLSIAGNSRVGGNLARAELTNDPSSESNAWAQGGGAYLVTSSLDVTSSLITGNQAYATGDGNDSPSFTASGGALFLGSVTATFDDATFEDNLALAETASIDEPGVAASGGAVLARSGSSITMNATVLVANEANAVLMGGTGGGGATAQGGALHGQVGTSTDTVTFDLTECTLDSNRALTTTMDPTSFASSRGGAAYVSSGTGNSMVTLRLDRSLLVGNVVEGPSSAGGGAVYAGTGTGEAQTWLRTTNSTFSANQAINSDPSIVSQGGSVYIYDGISLAYTHARFFNVTITEGLADHGGGIFVLGDQQDTVLTHSIVQGNDASVDPDLRCSGGTLASTSYNLVGAIGGCNVAGTGDLVGQAALLLPLADNGGPTATHAIPAASLAHDGGNPAGCASDAGAPLTVDQRGEPRPAEVACDIGAFELQP